MLSIPDKGVSKSLGYRKFNATEALESPDSLLTRIVPPTVELEARVILSLNFGVFGLAALSSWMADESPTLKS
jgi:hypothetical protein